MLTSLERYIPLFENYLKASDKSHFLAQLNDPTEKDVLTCLTSNLTDLNVFKDNMKKLGFSSQFQLSLLQYKLVNHALTVSELKENQITSLLKERYGVRDFEYNRPHTITNDNSVKTNEDKTPSSLTVDSSIQGYLDKKLQGKPQFVRQLNDYALSKLSHQVLNALPLAEKQYFLQKSGILFHYDTAFLSNFLHHFQTQKKKLNSTYRLNTKILSCLTKTQIQALGKVMPNIFTNQEFIELWFNQLYVQTINKYVGQQLSKQECEEKRKAFLNIIKQLQDKKNNPIIKSYVNKLNSQVLVLDMTVSDFDINRIVQFINSSNKIIRFNSINKEYLNKLRNQSMINKKEQIQPKIRFQLQVEKWQIETIVEDYILGLFKINDDNQSSINKLSQYLQDKYLRKLNARAKLMKGYNIQNMYQYFEAAELQSLKDKKQIKLSTCNKKKYKVQDEVKLEVSIKNVETITIKIYELNLQKHMLTTHAALDDELNLSYLIPTYQEVISHTVTNPYKVQDKEIIISKIPKTMGVFMVDLQGEGVTSRAVIRKGTIICLSSLTEAGQKFTFFDQNGKSLTEDDGLKVWIRNKPMKLTENWTIINYAQKKQYENVIASVGSYAETFMRTLEAEDYKLDVGYIYNSQSFIVGKKAKIILHSRLKMNDFSMSLQLLNKTKVKVTVTSNQGIQTFYSFDVPKWSNKSQQVIEFPIQSYTKNINIVVQSQITLQNKKEIILTNSKDIFIELGEGSTNFLDFYLSKNKENYILNAFGANGEAMQNLILNIGYTVKGVEQIEIQQLKTDQQGQINLGPLSIVKKLSAEINTIDVNYQRVWQIDQTENKFNYTNTIYYKMGHDIVLPIDPSWTKKDILLLKSFDKYYSRDDSSRLTIQKGKLTIQKITEDGFYILKLLPIDKTIEICTVKDLNWEGDTIENQKVYDQDEGKVYEMNKNLYQSISIKDIEFAQKESAVQAKIHLNLDGLTPAKIQNVRVHILANNFLTPQIPNTFKVQDFNLQPVFRQFYLQIKRSAYYSNKLLSDQSSYVYNRQKEAGIVGNNLQKPSIFLKRILVRETDLKDEELHGDGQYTEECAILKCDANMRERLKSRRAEVASRSIAGRALANLNSHNNFLLMSGDLQSNLNGQTISINIPEGYSSIQVYILSPESAIKNIFSVQRNSAIKTKDLRHAGLQKTNDNSGWTMSRAIYPLRQLQNKIVSRDSQWRTVGLSDIFDFANTKRIKLYDWSNHLLAWQSYTEEKKRQIFDKESCNQLNTFLKFKDRQFFDRVVKEFIKNKLYKTIVDLCLLGDSSVVDFVQINKLSKLNAFQKVLLVQELVRQKQNALAKIIVQSLELQQKSIKRNYEQFKNYFDTIINAKETKEKQLIKKKQMLQAMSCRRSKRENQIRNQVSLMDEEQEAGEQYINECSVQSYHMQKRLMNMQKKKEFVPIESTKEYTERTYYNIKNYKLQALNLISPSPFWSELARYFLNETSASFLTQSFMSFTTPIEFMLAACFVSSESSANFDIVNDGQNYQVCSKVPLLLYVKEVKQLPFLNKFGVLMNQRFIDPSNKYTIEEDGTQIQKQVEEFIINKPYIVQTVVTNTSGTPLELQVLLDIPKGTIPLKSHEYTQINSISIQPYSSLSFERYFYAPKQGTYQIYPSNACRGDLIISKAIAPDTIEVKTSYSINKLESFSDILRSGDKKQIIKFIQDKNIFDRNVFNPSQILWMLKEKEFYSQIISQLKQRKYFHQSIWNFGFLHNDIEAIRQILKMNYSDAIQASVFEYFPYYSSRTHQFANQNKSTIRNVQLKETYLKFLVSSVIIIQNKSDWAVSNCYYLILQDRLREAQQLIQSLSQKQYEEHRIQVDYMTCFLDMSLGSPNFTKARGIVSKYTDYPIESWRKLFTQVSNILNADDEEFEELGGDKKVEEYQTQILQEVGQFKIIQPADTDILVEFFQLNLELYFSEHAFYDVKTFSSMKSSVFKLFPKKSESQQIVIKRSDYPHIKDAFIEVSQYKPNLPPKQISTFTWSNPNIKVKINQNQGTLQVFTDKKRSAGSYVKVFADKNYRKNFYRDGYTDMTGKFRYAMSDLAGIKEFAIFVSTHIGGVIQTVKPPSQLSSF